MMSFKMYLGLFLIIISVLSCTTPVCTADDKAKCEDNSIVTCQDEKWTPLYDCTEIQKVCGYDAITGAALCVNQENANDQDINETSDNDAICTPNCIGKECGDDGCGNSCGNCSGDFHCNNNGQCEAGCECETGICCDGCSYKTTSTVCDNEVNKTYACRDGNGCGKDVFEQYKKQFCSGNNSNCTGDLSDWIYDLYSDCTSSEICVDGSSECVVESSCNCQDEDSFRCNDGDVYYYDSCDNIGNKKEECGESGLIGSNFCKDGDVYRTYKTVGCSGSSCTSTDSDQKQNDCSNGCSGGVCIECIANDSFRCNSGDVYYYDSCDNIGNKKEDCGESGLTGSNFCKDGDVYRTYETVGCSGTSCTSTESDQKQSDCSNGCSGGVCIECIANDSFRCNSGDVYYYDSCGNIGEVKEDCGESGYEGETYCKDLDVYKTFIDRSCTNNACKSINTEELYEDCTTNKYCINGSSCTIPFPNEINGIYWSDKLTEKLSVPDAVAFCSSIGGHLPTIDELKTLIKNCAATSTGGSCPVNNSCLYWPDCWEEVCSGCTDDESGNYNVFGDVDSFWSSSELVDDDGYYAKISFYTTYIAADNYLNAKWIRCVE